MSEEAVHERERFEVNASEKKRTSFRGYLNRMNRTQRALSGAF